MQGHESIQVTTRVALLRDNWPEYPANAGKSLLSRDVSRILEYHTGELDRKSRYLQQQEWVSKLRLYFLEFRVSSFRVVRRAGIQVTSEDVSLTVRNFGFSLLLASNAYILLCIHHQCP